MLLRFPFFVFRWNRNHIEAFAEKSDGVAGGENEFVLMRLTKKAAQLRVGDTARSNLVADQFLASGDEDLISGLKLGEEGENGAKGVVIPGIVRGMPEEDVLAWNFRSEEGSEADDPFLEVFVDGFGILRVFDGTKEVQLGDAQVYECFFIDDV